MVPPGDLFGLVPLWIAVYLIGALGLGLASYLAYVRVFQIVRLGRSERRFDQPLKRLWGLVAIVLGQARVLQRLSLRDLAGLGHAIYFYGFMTLTPSYLLFIALDSIKPGLSTQLLTPTGVKLYTSYMDLYSALVLAVLGWMLLRRGVFTPRRLSFDVTQRVEAYVLLALLGVFRLLAMLTDIFHVATGASDEFTAVLVAGAVGRWLLNQGISLEAATLFQEIFWWAHYLAILGFALYIVGVPHSKYRHVLTVHFNTLFRKLQPGGTLAPSQDLETAEHLGAGRLQDFTWKQLLDGQSCTMCGRCSASCPANLSGKVLSPMHIMVGMRDYMEEFGALLARGKEPPNDRPLVGGAISVQALWDCLSCGACVAECPVNIDHISSIVDMRRYLVMEAGEMPEAVQDTLTSIERRGHPWRGSQHNRTDWYQDLELTTLAEWEGEPPEVLFWVGCTGALMDRNIAVTRSIAQLLRAAGVRFGILGAEETCTGDPARRMGNELLWQVQAQQNIETFGRYGIRKIVTGCPHCFNTLRNEYPQLGGQYEVLHHSEYLSRLLEEGRLPISRAALQETITYHDSCYLTRHNGLQAAPRTLVDAASAQRLEMARSGAQAMCCGAGGGQLFISSQVGEKVNYLRAQQALDTGAQAVAVACPFCMQMFDEGLKAKAGDSAPPVFDVAQLMARALQAKAEGKRL